MVPSLTRGHRSDWTLVHSKDVETHGSAGSLAGILTSYASTDDYWNLRNFSFTVGLEEIGFIRIIWADQERAREVFRTPWRFKNKMGWCFDVDDLGSTWLSAHMYSKRPAASCSHLGFLGLNKQGISPEEMESDLQILDKEMGYTKERNKFMNERKDFAITEYIDVYERKRHGVGTLLYTEAAKYLATVGYPLYSCTIISEVAAATWRALFASGLYPMKKSKKLCFPRQQRYVLDYRSIK